MISAVLTPQKWLLSVQPIPIAPTLGPLSTTTTSEFGYHGLITDGDRRWQTSGGIRGAVNHRQYTSARSDRKDRNIA